VYDTGKILPEIEYQFETYTQAIPFKPEVSKVKTSQNAYTNPCATCCKENLKT